MKPSDVDYWGDGMRSSRRDPGNTISEGNGLHQVISTRRDTETCNSPWPARIIPLGTKQRGLDEAFQNAEVPFPDETDGSPKGTT
jgi:hypothetical protein